MSGRISARLGPDLWYVGPGVGRMPLVEEVTEAGVGVGVELVSTVAEADVIGLLVLYVIVLGGPPELLPDADVTVAKVFPDVGVTVVKLFPDVKVNVVNGEVGTGAGSDTVCVVREQSLKVPTGSMTIVSVQIATVTVPRGVIETDCIPAAEVVTGGVDVCIGIGVSDDHPQLLHLPRRRESTTPSLCSDDILNLKVRKGMAWVASIRAAEVLKHS